MRLTLATLLARSIKDIQAFSGKEIDTTAYINWVDKYQAQLVILSAQIFWSEQCENALGSIPNGDSSKVQEVLTVVEKTLNILADSVLQEQPHVRRLKLEQLVCLVFCVSLYNSSNFLIFQFDNHFLLILLDN